MIPQSQPKKPKNSSKANLVISAVFHGILLLALFYFAARSGMLGHQIQSITVTREKPKDKPKPPEKKPEPPKETPKVEPPKIAQTPKAAPPSTAPPVVAPPAAEAPAIEGFYGKEVVSESDPVQLYKGYIEYTLRSKWNRPDNMDDDKYVAEVAVNVDKAGNISQRQWLKGSGDEKWDQSVKDVFKAVSNIGRPPPTNFPPDVTVRFDVQEETEPVMTP
jgi:TonB family protein